jgi:hypothetical protein
MCKSYLSVWDDGIVAFWQLLESIQQMTYQRVDSSKPRAPTERHLPLGRVAGSMQYLDGITCNSYKAR